MISTKHLTENLHIEHTMKSTDDIFLLKLISKGNEAAFNVLFHRYYSALCRFAHVYVGERSISEEITLDVFTRLWELREEIIISTSVKAYLFQSVRNRSINYIRDHQHIVSIELVQLMDTYEIEDELEYNELSRVVESAVCSLPNKCKEIYEKSRNDELTNKEIASLMNISVRTVDAHIVSALKKIRTYIKKNYQ